MKLYEHWRTKLSALHASDRQQGDFQTWSVLQIASIPNLVIVDRATGKPVTTAGRDAIDADPTGAQFPWVPPTVSELAQGSVHTAAGKQSDFRTVSSGKVTGIYFSAHWCPPCRQFTPQLVDFYNKKKGTPEEFEVVFSSRCDVVSSFGRACVALVMRRSIVLYVALHATQCGSATDADASAGHRPRKSLIITQGQ